HRPSTSYYGPLHVRFAVPSSRRRTLKLPTATAPVRQRQITNSQLSAPQTSRPFHQGQITNLARPSIRLKLPTWIPLWNLFPQPPRPPWRVACSRLLGVSMLLLITPTPRSGSPIWRSFSPRGTLHPNQRLRFPRQGPLTNVFGKCTVRQIRGKAL